MEVVVNVVRHCSRANRQQIQQHTLTRQSFQAASYKHIGPPVLVYVSRPNY
jgi:hypothetical protein